MRSVVDALRWSDSYNCNQQLRWLFFHGACMLYVLSSTTWEHLSCSSFLSFL